MKEGVSSTLRNSASVFSLEQSEDGPLTLVAFHCQRRTSDAVRRRVAVQAVGCGTVRQRTTGARAAAGELAVELGEGVRRARGAEGGRGGGGVQGFCMRVGDDAAGVGSD